MPPTPWRLASAGCCLRAYLSTRLRPDLEPRGTRAAQLRMLCTRETLRHKVVCGCKRSWFGDGASGEFGCESRLVHGRFAGCVTRCGAISSALEGRAWAIESLGKQTGYEDAPGGRSSASLGGRPPGSAWSFSKPLPIFAHLLRSQILSRPISLFS